MEELLDASFSVPSLSNQRKIGDMFFPERVAVDIRGNMKTAIRLMNYFTALYQLKKLYNFGYQRVLRYMNRKGYERKRESIILINQSTFSCNDRSSRYKS
jgi:hypothetical protein